jgi:hypothetical protein
MSHLYLRVGISRLKNQRDKSDAKFYSTRNAFFFKDLAMATPVIIQHPVNGLTKKGYFGYSWTYLFFGWFVPLIRGELGVAALHLLFTMFTFGLWQVIVSFLYNKQFMTRMLEKGYVLKDTDEVMAQARMKLGIADLSK